MNNLLIKSVFSLYSIRVLDLSLLQRSRINYEKCNDRKVYMLEDDSWERFILKLFIDAKKVYNIEKLFSYLYNTNVKSHIIFPLLNHNNNYLSKILGKHYLLFPYYNLDKIGSLNLDDMINVSFNLHLYLNKLVGDLVQISNKRLLNKKWLLLVKIFVFDFVYFTNNINVYFNLQSNNIIHSSLWYWNIFLYKNNIIILDLDSITKWNILYDIIFILCNIYIFEKDIKTRFNLYNKVLRKYKDYISLDNIEFIVTYFVFLRASDINRDNLKDILTDIIVSLKFVWDLNIFLKAKWYDLSLWKYIKKEYLYF